MISFRHTIDAPYCSKQQSLSLIHISGVGAFKTALWQMGVLNTNQMREPVCALEGEDVDHIVHVLKKAGLMDADAPTRQSTWSACPVFGCSA